MDIDFQITRESLLYIQVCANFETKNYKARKKLLGLLPPSGTSLGWCNFSRKKEHKPVQCAERKGYWHYIINC